MPVTTSSQPKDRSFSAIEAAMSVEHQLRMLMKITPPACDFILSIGDTVSNGHGADPLKTVEQAHHKRLAH